MKTVPTIKFPITTAEFIAFQEAGGERKALDAEVAALTAWTQVINDAFLAGMHREEETLLRYIDNMDDYIHQEEKDKVCARFLKSMRWWIAYAWKQGREAAEREAEV